MKNMKDMKAESSTTKPWWSFLEVVDLGNCVPLGSRTIDGALNLKALSENQSCYTAGVYGQLGELSSIDTIKDLLAFYNAKLLNRDISSDAESDPEEAVYYWDSGYVELCVNKGGTIRMTICHFDESLVKTLDLAVRGMLTKQKGGRGKAFVLGSSRNGLELMSIGKAGVEFIPENYTDKVVEDFNHVIADLKNSDPCGRLIVMEGVAGCGKTYLVRNLMLSVPEAIFVIIPSHLVSSLASPDLLPLLIKTCRQNPESPIILVAEDADQVLSSRSADNIASISTLLNFGAGIMGSMVNVRLVATTNISIGEIDDAITRKGRMCRHIEVVPLQRDHANRVFKRLTNKEGPFKDKSERYSLAAVYSAAKDNGWEPPKKARSIGFNTSSDDEETTPFDDDAFSAGMREIAVYVADTEEDFLEQLGLDEDD